MSSRSPADESAGLKPHIERMKPDWAKKQLAELGSFNPPTSALSEVCPELNRRVERVSLGTFLKVT
jgi:hypothetical protein